MERLWRGFMLADVSNDFAAHAVVAVASGPAVQREHERSQGIGETAAHSGPGCRGSRECGRHDRRGPGTPAPPAASPDRWRWSPAHMLAPTWARMAFKNGEHRRNVSCRLRRISGLNDVLARQDLSLHGDVQYEVGVSRCGDPLHTFCASSGRCPKTNSSSRQSYSWACTSDIAKCG